MKLSNTLPIIAAGLLTSCADQFEIRTQAKREEAAQKKEASIDWDEFMRERQERIAAITTKRKEYLKEVEKKVREKISSRVEEEHINFLRFIAKKELNSEQVKKIFWGIELNGTNTHIVIEVRHHPESDPFLSEINVEKSKKMSIENMNYVLEILADADVKLNDTFKKIKKGEMDPKSL